MFVFVLDDFFFGVIALPCMFVVCLKERTLKISFIRYVVVFAGAQIVICHND